MPPALSPAPAALLAGLSLAASLACDVTIKDGDFSVDTLQGNASREWSRSYPLAPGGRVEIVNVNGTIDVSAGSAGTVDVAAVLTAHAITRERAQQVLDEADIAESATPGHVRVASVRRRESRGPGRLEVHYKLVVPPDARVEANGNNGSVRAAGIEGAVKALMVNGEVELTGVRGAVDAGSINGRVRVKMAEVTDRIRLESTNGSITLEIPRGAGAALTARALNGGITVRGLEAQASTGRRIRTLESVLGGGGPEIDLRAMNGRITIAGVEPR